jgi:hypothetical protein
MSRLNGQKLKGQELQGSNTVSWLQAIGSGIAAAFGVQSRKNRERDFEHGDIRKFAVAGLIVTAMLLIALIGIVEIVLAR